MLVPIKASGNRPPMYVIHGHGLYVLNLIHLANHLHPQQPLIGVQANSLDGTGEPLDNISDMAASYSDEILAKEPKSPLILAGYSSGGIIAYEMRRQLETIGKRVKLLIIFDGTADPLPESRTGMRNKIIFRIQKTWWQLRHPIFAVSHKMESLAEKRRLLLLADSKSYYQWLCYVMEKHNDAFKNYRLVPSNNSIHLFRASERKYFEMNSRFLGWKKYTGNEIRVYKVPGDHDTMFKPPHVKEFARILQNLLDNANPG